MLETVLFYLFSLGVVGFSTGVVLSRSAVYSVLSLVAALCMMAGLFVLLKAFLVATILVLVYAGAILVLFLFVVMMADFRKLAEAPWKGAHGRLWTLLSLGVGGAVFLQILAVLRTLAQPSAVPAHGTTEAMGRMLFGNYVLPFELTAFLVLSAVVSVVVLARKEAP